MSRFRVVVTTRAEAQIRTIHEWWKANRVAAPDLFTDELASAVERLAEVPYTGSPYVVARPAGVRRTALRRTRCHVYFTVDEAARLVVVRAVWHMSRGRRPALR